MPSNESFIKQAAEKVRSVYESVWIRLGLTLIIIVITVLVYKIVKGVSYNNLWLICSFGVTFVITGVIFLTINFPKNKSNDLADERVVLYVVSGILFAIFLVSLIKFWRPSEFNTLILNLLAVLISVLILGVDCYLVRSGRFPRLREIYFPFDLSVVVGVSVVVVLDLIGEHILGIMSKLGGGAAAFQIIMANLVFDPRNYEPSG